MLLQDAKLVYVDDNRFNLALIKAFAQELKLNLKIFLDSKEALDYVLNNDVDLVLLDYMMPELNGIEFAKILKEKKPFVPIIMISAFDDYKLRAEARKVGIDDFLPKPVDLESFQNRVVNKIKQLDKNNVSLKTDKNKQSIKQDTKSIYEIFSKLGVSRDKTYQNIMNIAEIAKIIALELKTQEYANKVYKAALFYDIGKTQIPADILLKPSKLTKEEFDLVKTHTTLGYNMLNTEDEILQMAAIMALNHHEKFNAEGYPRGLKADNIPLCARIIAVADVFDALLNRKTYRDKMTLNDAVDLILKERGKSFDPEIVDIFYNNIDSIRLMYL